MAGTNASPNRNCCSRILSHDRGGYAHHIWHSGGMLTSLSQQWRYWARVTQVLGVERSRTLESVGVGPAEDGAP